jgi:hypothetical protein
MQPINWTRVLLGGLLCGLIINAGEFVLNGVIFAESWQEISRSMNKPADPTPNQIAAWNVWGFALGITAVWLYAAIRPRYGIGVRTAACAGVAAWLMACLLGGAALIIQNWIPASMWLTMMIWSLVELVIATIAGAWLYREPASLGTASTRVGSGTGVGV